MRVWDGMPVGGEMRLWRLVQLPLGQPAAESHVGLHRYTSTEYL